MKGALEDPSQVSLLSVLEPKRGQRNEQKSPSAHQLSCCPQPRSHHTLNSTFSIPAHTVAADTIT